MYSVTQRLLKWVGVALAIPLLPACGSSAARQPPGRPPSPESVSVAEPGGDAADPHEAALLRQLASPWGRRNDKDDQVEVPLLDWEHWKRVRYWGVEHFVGFRYGKEHHAIAILRVQELSPGAPVESRACVRQFEAWARPQLRAYAVHLETTSEKQALWRDQPIVVRFLDGSYSFGFSKRSFSAAWVAYPAYPDACLVYAIAVPWDSAPELARRVRDRWVSEGFAQTATKTSDKPQRR